MGQAWMSVRKHPLRFMLKLSWLIGEILLAAARYLLHCSFRIDPVRRAKWLHESCRRTLCILPVRVEPHGELPAKGLLVSNHVSYLDILVIASVRPAVFVSKHDIRDWPVFGWFASKAGTLFVDRARRSEVGIIARQIAQRLDEGLLVVLFPEGTSSGGDTVLPFKSSLLEPAVGQKHAITAACIWYSLENGDVREEVCYWRDMVFVPHAINLLTKRSIRASLTCVPLPEPAGNRKDLARQLRGEVLGLLQTKPNGAAEHH